MTRRENRGERRPAQRESRLRIPVVCGGAVTEPQYLTGLRQAHHNRAIDITVAKEPKSPEIVVDTAIKRRRSGDFDEVWCVVDVDEFDLVPAVRKARAGKVSLAISNPCFELWLLLHFEDCRAHLADCEAAARRLRRYRPGYDKSVDFAHYANGLDAARRRARELEPGGEHDPNNPSTGVWRLIEAMVRDDG